MANRILEIPAGTPTARVPRDGAYNDRELFNYLRANLLSRGESAIDHGASPDASAAENAAAFQSMMDAAGPNGWGFIPPGIYAYDQTLKLLGYQTLFAAGMPGTFLLYSGSGPAIREKTAAEGNAAGASGIILRDFWLQGDGASGDGISLGLTHETINHNFLGSIQNVTVREFDQGTGVKVSGNAVTYIGVRTYLNDVGYHVAGGGSNKHIDIHSENNISEDLIADGITDEWFGVHCETMTGNTTDPVILVNGFNNAFYGVGVTLGGNRGNIVRDLGERNSFSGLTVMPNGHAYTNTYSHGTWGYGTGPVDILGYHIHHSGGMPGITVYDLSSNYRLALRGNSLQVLEVTYIDELGLRTRYHATDKPTFTANGQLAIEGDSGRLYFQAGGARYYVEGVADP